MAVKVERVPLSRRAGHYRAFKVVLPESLGEVSDDLETFWRAIADRPRDAVPKLIFADRLDELGDRRGECLRWIADTGREPLQTDYGNTAVWGWCIHYPSCVVMPWAVPRHLFNRLPMRYRRLLASSPSSGHTQIYRCLGGDGPVWAIRALCRAWAQHL
jgi:uncharacterized protein (TIGR02996 family)